MQAIDFIAVAVVLNVVLWVLALLDIARRQFADPNTKLMWFVNVLITHGLGAIVYFTFGRKAGVLPATAAQTAAR